jgi:hypothetical protein
LDLIITNGDAGDLSPLPFLDQAVRRMLEELPGPEGLSRSERQILTALASGISTPPAIRRSAADRAGRVHGGLELLGIA